jgi:hypothetical protein
MITFVDVLYFGIVCGAYLNESAMPVYGYKQYHMDRISWMRPYIIGKDLLMQPVSITNNILSSNQPRGELYM